MKICLANSDNEIQQIRQLQSLNLKENVEDSAIDGFVTACYSEAFLHNMNSSTPAIIAKEKNKVVGYALATERSLLKNHPLLNDLSDQINDIPFCGKRIGDFEYLVVGQLCVAKEVRGQGVSQQLYRTFKNTYKDHYPFAVTDVDTENLASFRTHIKAGFKAVGTLHYGDSDWNVVVWDWRSNS